MEELRGETSNHPLNVLMRRDASGNTMVKYKLALHGSQWKGLKHTSAPPSAAPEILINDDGKITTGDAPLQLDGKPMTLDNFVYVQYI